MRDFIKNQLELMKFAFDNISEIRTKDGVSVWRVFCGSNAYVIKYFEKECYRREIENYAILQNLDVKTIKIVAKTDCAILMEDIKNSTNYRLGIPEDLNDIKVVKAVAQWYKNLHNKGYALISKFNGKLYDENDVITKENLKFISTKTQTENSEVWDLLNDNFDVLQIIISRQKRTLTYNDFHYTNLIVSNDKSTAFMFDYNMLGKGYAYSDIRNVCYSLSDNAKTVFLSEYGYFDEKEKLVDDVVSVLTTLYIACNREVFPSWAEPYIEQIKNGELLKSVKSGVNDEHT